MSWKRFGVIRPVIIVFLVLIGGIVVFGNKFFEPDEDVFQIDVAIPTLSEIAQQGKNLFDANCARCHGPNAAGGQGGPPLIHKIYESGHHGDIAFLLAAKRGVPAHHWQYGNMPAIPDVTEKDVAQIVTYIREVQRANGIL